MNKINIFHEHLYEALQQDKELTMEAALQEAKNAGIDGLECDFYRLTNDGGWENNKQLFERNGFQVRSIYCGFDFLKDEEATSIKKINDVIECASYFGAGRILAIPGFVEEGEDSCAAVEKMAYFLKIMVEKGKEKNILITLEDYDLSTAPFSTIEGLDTFMRKVPGLGLTFDTGNFAYSMESEKEAYKKLSKYIVHVHLKDRSTDSSRGNGCNEKEDVQGNIMYPCEIGGGYIEIEKIVRWLLEDGYHESFSIEHFGAVNQRDYMKKSAEYVKKLIGQA